MRPPLPTHLPVRAASLTLAALALTALSLACSDAAAPPLAPALPSGPHLIVGPVITVTNTDDNGPGSLRQAIADAPDGATIQFDAAIAGKTILLTTGELQILGLVTIEGPVAAGMTISGGLGSGVISIGSDAEVTLRNLSIVDGKAMEGAGILNRGTLTLDHSLVANNQVMPGGKPRGGGIFSTDNSTDLTLLNSTVSGNYAEDGGGIYNLGGPVTLRNSTIAFNRANDGGGFWGGGVLSVRNSIIANNADDGTNVPSSSNCNGLGTTVFTGVNIASDATCGTDAALLIADPLLADLVNNGGPTKTHALHVGSPAIDLGAQCTEATDQRYVARPVGASCDAGAYEFDSFARVSITPGPNAMVIAKTGVVTLGGTITCSAPGTIPLGVSLSQTQKITGRFTTIVQATGQTSVNCLGTSSWSITLTPQTGKFDKGSATATVETTPVPGGFLPASVTSPVKLFTVAK